MSILVLGHKGMLGHMVVKYLRDNSYEVETVDFKFPTTDFNTYIAEYSGDYIINCIGAIPQKTKEFNVNKELPIWLAENSKCKVIHPGTDCEMDDDAYGVSKRIARDFLVANSTNTKIIKASIIGPELGSRSSLLEWFLHSSEEVRGYSNAMWSGITTLEWSKQCRAILSDWESYPTETIVESTCLSKYNLLSLIKEIFNVDTNIVADPTVSVNKCLVGTTQATDITTQLHELKTYYYNNDPVK